MNLKLPRPYSPKLPKSEAILLECLSILDTDRSGIVETDLSTIAVVLRVPLSKVEEDMAALKRRNIVLLSSNEFAILARISRNLKSERDRNRKRRIRGAAEDWSFARRVSRAFPALREGYRPASYNRPAAFESLFKQHEHFHRKACPPDVEVLTEACYPGELETVLTLIAEQVSANRSPVLLYTRKAVYVAVRRSPKR